jgi:ammonium transporter, Amt family
MSPGLAAAMRAATLLSNAADLREVAASIDVLFVLVSGNLVFLMQAGFAMLTAGSVRSKNSRNVLTKNVLDACVVAIAYYIFGFALAFGPGGNKFFGLGNFALADYNGVPFARYHFYFFHWAFAATGATIVSGSVAERTSVYAYIGYAMFLSAFVYPIVSHWVWSPNGWLANIFGDGKGMIDFAGCSVVHMVGGFSGLAGAVIVRPRIGRFDSEGKVMPIPGHSATLCTMGTFLLWFGWYGFNPGSTGGLGGTLRETAARCAVNTTLSASAAGITTLAIYRTRDGVLDLAGSLNGIIAGLVSITASCAFVEPYAAIIIGVIGSCAYVGSAQVLLRFCVDDPLEAFPIHGICGLWGVIAVGFFNKTELQASAGFSTKHSGIFDGTGGSLLAANLVGAIIIAVWTLCLIGPLFFIMNCAGVLRISADEEIIGKKLRFRLRPEPTLPSFSSRESCRLLTRVCLSSTINCPRFIPTDRQ